jgi:hypothetical protein
MKTKHPPKIAGTLLLFAILSAQPSAVFAQGTAFTYQGQLSNGANPANGSYDLTFSLYNSSSGGTQFGSTLTSTGVTVSNGLFVVTNDFGSVYNGTSYWLQIGVRTNGGGMFSPLSPRQALTPVPYSITAENVTGAIPLGLLPAAVVTNNEANVTLGGLTVSGNLNLPAPTTINGGGSTLLYADSNGNFYNGPDAGNIPTGGSANTGEGLATLNSVTSGSENTAQGASALRSDTTGSYNTATGFTALYANVDGASNTASGWAALYSNTKGSQNVAVGYSALAYDTTGFANVAIGALSLEYNGGSDNTAVGYFALGGQSGSAGGGNTAVGSSCISSLTTGYNNVGMGYQSLTADSTGFDNVGIGVASFQANSAGSQNTAVGTYAFQLTTSGSGNIGLGYTAGKFLTSGNNNIYIGNSGNSSESGIIRIGTPGTQTLTYIAGTIENPSCNNLTITGGSDLAEPFNITTAAEPVSEGAVVVIDEAHPGQLRLTDQAYDTRVAGVVSGANGVHPGIRMHQEGMLEGGKNVALSGRVYVQADTSNGAIRPGDLLTTSATPGHAMKVSDHVRAQGAILGKAMTALPEGKGMVLVLVTLQ